MTRALTLCVLGAISVAYLVIGILFAVNAIEERSPVWAALSFGAFVSALVFWYVAWRLTAKPIDRLVNKR